MPASISARIAMITVKVRRAACTTGSRNACTPLLTASTPVIAVHPLENALTSSQALTAVTACGLGGATTGMGCPPLKSAFVVPIAMAPSRQATNK